MTKLYIRNTVIGLILMGICVGASMIVMTALGLLIKVIWKDAGLIPAYIIGAIIGIVICILMRKHLFSYDNYYMQRDIDGADEDHFWIERLKEKNFVKHGAVRATYIPSLVLGLALVTVAVVVYPLLQGGANEYDNIVRFAAWGGFGSIVCTAASALIMYGIIGMLSVKACKKCGSVNSFIYDEFLDYNSAEGFAGGGMSYSYSRGRGGISYGGGGYSTFKVASNGTRVARHCACCEEKSVITEAVNDSKALQ